ncbi:retroviral-like aspartic protease family protein [Roseomonas sp. USHLN139]|uniref:retroviral-like aspartic protease family protein n=1 Tax=Roseomonas sp. USHLN139 TaxID=3081298 RepID=UPI003B022C70
MPPALPARPRHRPGHRPWHGPWHRRLALLPLLFLGACAATCLPEQANRLPLVNDGNVPLTLLTINGQPAVFLVDTGAARTALLPEGAAALGLTQDGLRRTQARGIGGSSHEANALVSELTLGSLTMRGLTVPVVRHGAPPRRDRLGLLGADVLRVHELEMDTPGGQLTLWPGQGCGAGGPRWPTPSQSIPIELYGEAVPIVTLRVNGRAVPALFDTGAQRTVLDRRLAIALGMPADAPTGPRLHGVGEETVVTQAWRLPQLDFAGLTLHDHPVLVAALERRPYAMALGQDVIGQRRFWLSYARRRLFLDAVAAP